MSETAVARALKDRFASFGITHLIVEDLQTIEDGTVDAVLLNTRTQARVRLNVDPSTGAIQQGEVVGPQPTGEAVPSPATRRACEY
ncbi:MAG: hypothetical protein LPL00_03560 [Alphaproteobacteria bacterium]|nr:hypothetical protein [Alphaproteobacteria bacterium]MDX5368561.1 hypothetical protein [Alphaproteobacteria bacterium]MDX5463315.1 hypothetical protein [Alphaproteobacteria bacterium]